MKRQLAILLALCCFCTVSLAAQQRKEIKNPAEYNSYIAALREANPQAQAQAFENFLQQYPNTVVKEDALEQLMAAYEKLGNAAKTTETAGRVLQVDPNNVRALALLAYTSRASAEAGQAPQQNAADAAKYGQGGLRALATMSKPEGMSDADFEKFMTQVAIIFNGSAGFGALQNKDFFGAQKYLQAAVDLEIKQNPNDPNALRDIYPLALAHLEATPISPTGLWWIARSAALSNNNPQILKYGQFKYTKYHGSPDGWDQLLAQAKASAAPPADFFVAPAFSPAEQAKRLADTKNPKEMTFDELQLILTDGSPEVQQKVWALIKGTEIPFAAKVINATRNKMELAATADDIEKNVADVTLTMVAPLPLTKVPNAGDETQVLGKLDSYTSSPFMFNMVEGQLIAKPSAKPLSASGPDRGTQNERASRTPNVTDPHEIYKRASQSVVVITTEDEAGQAATLGSGFFIRDGVIATNFHVIKGASKAYAQLVGKRAPFVIDGIVAIDEQQDLVLLKVGGMNAPLLSIEDGKPAVGDTVYALGNPEGLEGTFTPGMVSGIRNLRSGTLIQISAPISHGSSGGPVLNAQGRVIGVAVAFLEGGQNLNFAIPASYLNRLLTTMRTHPIPISAQEWLTSR